MKQNILIVMYVLLGLGLNAQNESKIVVDAATNQTNSNPLIRLRNGQGADVMWIHSDNPTNVFVGYATGIANNTSNVINGIGNTFVGSAAAYFNSTAFENTALGNAALYNTSTGNENTAVGSRALYASSTGQYNTAIGNQALGTTTTSRFNTALGFQAGAYHNNGWNNTFLGAQSGANQPGLYNIVAIGQGTTVGAVSTARLGNSSTVSCGGQVGWTTVSDGRFKKNVKSDVVGLDFILKLKPVTYNLDVTNLSKALNENSGKEWDASMKKAISDKEKIKQTGFIAQEVEAVAKSLGYDFSGIDGPKNEKDIYGLRYAEFVVPLVKAVQELNQKVDDLTNDKELLTARLAQIEALLLMGENHLEATVTYNQK